MGSTFESSFPQKSYMDTPIRGENCAWIPYYHQGRGRGTRYNPKLDVSLKQESLQTETDMMSVIKAGEARMKSRASSANIHSATRVGFPVTKSRANRDEIHDVVYLRALERISEEDATAQYRAIVHRAEIRTGLLRRLLRKMLPSAVL